VRLILASPGGVAADVEGVHAVRGEDATGHFGILPGHAAFVTVLGVSVLSWRTDAGERFAAVRGGVLAVEDGDVVRVGSPEAVVADGLEALQAEVMARMERDAQAERQARQVVERIERQALAELAREARLAGRGV
jgi:F-type H+-transporting ATPase subunit epsilon